MDRLTTMTRCPHCGNDEYYVKCCVRGSCRYYSRFDGKEIDNDDSYDHLVHLYGKYAYCADCHKRLCLIASLEG